MSRVFGRNNYLYLKAISIVFFVTSYFLDNIENLIYSVRCYRNVYIG